jgi:ABC-2 type transport system ATP-binding protein
MDTAIEIDRLTRHFGKVEAVNGLTLAVPEGSVFALVGPNGAGKTTTIKLLMNLLWPSSGRSALLGTPSSRLGPATLKQVGYVSENQDLPLWMTVRQLAAFCQPLYPTWDRAFAEEMRCRFDLPADRPLKVLSRGMRMKAALLCSLAYRPRVLILDEPFGGLDPLVREDLVEGILRLTEQERWTVFISSHDVDEIEALADQAGFINNGRLHLAEPVFALLTRFRQIEVALDRDVPLPTSLPPAWLLPEAGSRMLRFVDSAWSEPETEQHIRRLFPVSRQVTATRMSLKAIFVAMARTWRGAADPKEAL